MLLLVSAFSLFSSAGFAFSLEAEVREALMKNDWSELVLLLGPRRGQNIEHDLLLARAYLQMEKRSDAIKLLASAHASRKDERLLRMLRTAGEIFFSQETSQLHSEGLRLLSQEKFVEAHEKWEQAVSREPGNTLVLLRLLQVELLLQRIEPALQRWKELQISAPYLIEARLFAIQLQNLAADSGIEAPKVPAISRRIELEVPMVFQLEQWKRQQRLDEIRAVARDTLPRHPEWAHVQAWLLRNKLLGVPEGKRIRTLLDRNLKDKTRFLERMDQEMRRTQYLWVGYLRYEDLLKP